MKLLIKNYIIAYTEISKKYKSLIPSKKDAKSNVKIKAGKFVDANQIDLEK